MLILITTCCQEGCSHCLHDARSDGYNMPLEICQDVIEFLKIVDPKLIQISGGEPTLHPKFVDIVESIANTFRRITVLVESNGSFFKYANRAKQVNRVLKIKNVHMQIRTHELYYPNYQEIVNNKILLRMPKTDVFHDHIRIFPIGRASKMKSEIKYRTCINTFLVHKQLPTLTIPKIANFLQKNGKFCSPLIDPKGIIHAGESIFCTELGHVSNSNSIPNIKPCGKCGLQGDFL